MWPLLRLRTAKWYGRMISPRSAGGMHEWSLDCPPARYRPSRGLLKMAACCLSFHLMLIQFSFCVGKLLFES